jgi:WhiB family transcriptional regulator, redox-sensing transcriptional regulator
MTESTYIRADWRDYAECRDMDPELFFPVGTTGPSLDQIGRAKKVCAECLARVSCLEWALAAGEDAGVWGGTTEDERRALRRRDTYRGTHRDIARLDGALGRS